MAWNTEEQDTQRNEVLTDFFGGHQEEELTSEWLERLREFEGLMMKYNSAIREVATKLEVLNDELSFSSRRNPIESIQARIKRPYSIARKLRRLGQPVTVESISTNLNDVAGVRVICPFLDDIYAISDMLLKQDDIQLVAKKDYIQQPKPNGYRSLHLIIEIPIFFSTGKEMTRVEIQIRTVAMNFWASLEHQIRYKNDVVVQPEIVEKLSACADRIAETDWEMMQLRDQIAAQGKEHR